MTRLRTRERGVVLLLVLWVFMTLGVLALDFSQYMRDDATTALNFTDFLYRPRRPEELATASGGGVVFSQAAHQVDIVRLLAGGHAQSVRAMAGAWDARRATEGAYAALIAFEGHARSARS